MKKILPATIILLALWAILLIPFQIIGQGFLPPDDALWHSAKIISGKDWNEVLVLRDEVRIESHPGWHAILGFIHRISKCDAFALVLFSVIFLFILFAIMPLLFLRYPESWILTLLAISIVGPGWIFRLVLGRPYIMTMAALLLMLFIWPRLKSKKIDYGAVAILTLAIAVTTWVHRTWYMLLIPVVSFLLAREWRASLWILVSSIAGIFIGASFTGHPIILLKQTILHLFLVLGSYETQDTLVGELRPTLIDFNVMMLIIAAMFWRVLRGRWDRRSIDNPAFILIILCFVAGLITKRIWLDIGVVALTVWIANEFEDFFILRLDKASVARIFLTIFLSIATFLSFTSDVSSRWSGCRPKDYLSSADPEQTKWLPGPRGIVYSDDMGVFFRTVFKNPHGDWRYILGSEAAIMPEDDLKILRNIQRNRHTFKSFEPWVKKMKPEDRLIIGGDEDHKPNIPELEWKYAALGTWVGRKPQDIKK